MSSEVPSVLFINRVYPPAGGATGALLAELAEDLVEAGWPVSVVTGPAPGAPPQEVRGGVHVHRVSSLPFDRHQTVRRALAYLSLYPMLFLKAAQLRSHDVVVTKTDPPMQFVFAPLLKAWTGQALIHWAQDVYPDIAEAVGVIRRRGLLARLLRPLATAALRRHDRVMAIGRCMKARLVERGLTPDDIAVVPNWPPDTVEPVPHAENPFRHEHELDDAFVVMYSGNMGLAHRFEPILDAAALLRFDPQVVFLFVGDGPRRAAIQQRAAGRGLDNVRFLPFQPFDQLAYSLSAADLHLVTMRAGTNGLVVPSKAYGALAAGRPCLLLGPDDSEVGQLIAEHECGAALPGATGRELADAIWAWKQDAQRRREAQRNAAASVKNARRRAVERFTQLVREVLPSRSSKSVSEAR